MQIFDLSSIILTKYLGTALEAQNDVLAHFRLKFSVLLLNQFLTGSDLRSFSHNLNMSSPVINLFFIFLSITSVAVCVFLWYLVSGRREVRLITILWFWTVNYWRCTCSPRVHKLPLNFIMSGTQILGSLFHSRLCPSLPWKKISERFRGRSC